MDYAAIKWLKDVLRSINVQLPINNQLAIMLNVKMKSLCDSLSDEMPYFHDELVALYNNLFYNFNMVNPIILGRIIEILKILETDKTIFIWNYIHPEIARVSKKLYLDGHYANAAEDAFIEINDRVKKLYKILKPTDKVPDGVSAMERVFSVNAPMIEFCDNSTESGQNTQKGFMQMLSGSMSALRNPKAHSNDEKLSAEESMRRLMVASMLMYKIDEGVQNSGIQE